MGEWPTLGRPETSVMVTNHKPGKETFQNWLLAEILRHQTLQSYSLLHIIIIIISSDPRRRRTMLWTFFKTTTKHWPKQKENKTLDILGHNGGGGCGREASLVGETCTSLTSSNHQDAIFHRLFFILSWPWEYKFVSTMIEKENKPLISGRPRTRKSPRQRFVTRAHLDNIYKDLGINWT